MQFTNPDTDVFVPDGIGTDDALARTTHLAIGAHQDDLEFMALHGILECLSRPERWFTGVTMTDGTGSARSGPYAEYSDEEMSETRVTEQRKAAEMGEYGCQIQLMFPSATVKDARESGPVEDLAAILEVARPQTVYLHNPADKHDTHVACVLRSIDALRTLPPDRRPMSVYGCELWRDLDWLVDSDKRLLPVDDRPDLGEALGTPDARARGICRCAVGYFSFSGCPGLARHSHVVPGMGSSRPSDISPDPRCSRENRYSP